MSLVKKSLDFLNFRKGYIRIQAAPSSLLPLSLNDSTFLLRALQHHFGPVTHFQNPKYGKGRPVHLENLFVIFDTAKALTKAIEASPWTIGLPDHDDPSSTSKQRPKSELTCAVFPSQSDLLAHARSSPYRGPWPVVNLEEGSLPVRDLLSQGAPGIQYADCSVKDRRLYTPDQQRKSLAEVDLGYGKGGLMGLWKEGRRKRQQVLDDRNARPKSSEDHLAELSE